MTFFENIAEFFSQLWDLLCNALSMFSLAFEIVTSSVFGVQVIFMYMPTVIGSCCLVVLGVLVLRFLLLK